MSRRPRRGVLERLGLSDFADGSCPTQAGDSYLCPTATAGESYALDITLKEPWPGCTNMRVSSGSLPPGLSLSSEGNIRGTPTAGGSFPFYITVLSDVAPCVKGANSDSDRKFVINVNGAKPRLIVATGSLPDGNINQAYTAPALAASGDTVNSWSLAGGTLPPGLTLASSGVISGTPTQSGSFAFSVQANGNGTSDTKQLSIFVLAPLELQTLVGKKPPTTGLTAKAAVSASLTTGLKAVGARVPYVFSSNGALPPGIALDAATGALTGPARPQAGSPRRSPSPTRPARRRLCRGRSRPPAPRLRQGKGSPAGDCQQALLGEDPRDGEGREDGAVRDQRQDPARARARRDRPDA